MPQIRRQPAGTPIGGQFAGTDRAPAGILLGDDPWADAFGDDVCDAQHLVDPVEELRRTADLVSLAVSPAPSLYTGATESERAAADARCEQINAAMATIRDEFGSAEAAARHVGEQVAARAEEIAGITSAQVRDDYQQRLTDATARRDVAKRAHDEFIAEREAATEELRTQLLHAHDPGERTRLRGQIHQIHNQLQPRWVEVLDNLTSARLEYQPLVNGADPACQENLRRLADGYAQAVAEVREVGGQMLWHEKSAKKAQRAFDEATEVFPTDWIQASNDRVGGQTTASTLMGERSIQDQAPVVKISRSRAHYMDVSTQKTRKKTVVSSISFGFGDEDMETYGRSSSPYSEYEPLTEEEAAKHRGRAGQTGYRRTSYEVASRFGRGDFDDVTPPKGPGWERWTSPTSPDRVLWRRPKKRMQTVSSQVAPEITTNETRSCVQGRSGTFAVATHELSHRFEYSVPGITKLEAQFLQRRTTDPETGEQEKLRNLYPGSRKGEYARPDSFINAYMGKEYSHSDAHEILSMGTDAIYGGRSGGLIGINDCKPDEDMRAFILGVHACAGRK